MPGIKYEDVERGMVVIKPGTVTPHTEFDPIAYFFRTRRAGDAFHFQNYRAEFDLRATDVTGILTLPQGTEMVGPGDSTTSTVQLIEQIATEERTRFVRAAASSAPI